MGHFGRWRRPSLVKNVEGDRVSGAGDTTVNLKRAFLVEDLTDYGLELGTKLPTAKKAIGSGKANFTLNAIFSRDVAKAHVDINHGATRLGAPDDGTSRFQTAFSTSLSLQISSIWTAMTEVSVTWHSGAPTTAQLLAAVSYSSTKRYSIDADVALGLGSGSQDWSFFTGMVIPVTRLW